MDFLTFLRGSRPRMTDPSVIAAIDTLLRLEDLPPSSDPRVIARATHKLLDLQATKGLQTAWMVYAQLEPANELPPDLKNDPAKLLAAINAIIELQDLSRRSGNNDPDHRWPSPAHQQRFGRGKS